MGVKETLFNLSNATDDMKTAVENLSQALYLWQERLDAEGYQNPDGELDRVKAVCFIGRFPAFLAQHHIFLEHLDTIAATLEKISDEGFAAYKQLKEEEKTNAD